MPLAAIQARGIEDMRHHPMGCEQSDVNARMRPWSDAEISRFLFRHALFQRRGYSEDDSELIADRLALRDQDRDDRRICIECSNWQRSRTCARRLPASPLQLIRCPWFAWAKP